MVKKHVIIAAVCSFCLFFLLPCLRADVTFQADLAVNPSAVSIGQNLTIVMHVTNTGIHDALNVSGENLVISGPGNAAYIAGPVPFSLNVPATGNEYFTWYYMATAAGCMSFSTRAYGTDISNGSTVYSSAVTSNTVCIQTPASLSCDLSATPSQVSVGQFITIIMTVSNTGQATALAVSPSSLVRLGTGFSTPSNPNMPSPPTASIPGSGSVSFTWTVSAAGAGTIGWNGNASGTDANSGMTVLSVACTSNDVLIQYPAALSCALYANPDKVSTGQMITVIMAVTNTGGADAVNAGPGALMQVGSGGSELISGPLPAGPQTIPGGGSVLFTWTYSAAGTGTFYFRGSSSGNDSNSGIPLGCGITDSNTVIKQSPAALSCAISMFPDTIDLGLQITVIMTVTNTGDAGAIDVSPSTLFQTGTGGAVPVTGPAPASVSLSGGVSQNFTWIFVSTAQGNICLSGYAQGTDSNSGMTVSSLPALDCINITPPLAKLEIGCLSSSGVVSVGQAVTVIINVSNTGADNAENVNALMTVLGDSASLTLLAGPLPVNAYISAGTATQFTWLYSCTGPGTVSFYAEASGTDVVWGVTVNADPVTCGPVIMQTPASLYCSLDAYPAQVSIGQTITLVMTVTNGGQAAALTVFWDEPGISGTGWAELFSFSIYKNIGGGSEASFTWRYTAVSAGTVIFSSSAHGTDTNSGITVSTSVCTSNDVLIQSPAALSCGISAFPGPAAQGELITVVMSVTNTGQAGANSVHPEGFTSYGGAGAAYLSGPMPFMTDVGGGGSGYFTWVYMATSAGSLCFSGIALGYDANTTFVTIYSPGCAGCIEVNAPTPTPTISPTHTITHTAVPTISPPCFVLMWGSSGTGNGQFDHPYNLTTDSSGNVYVTDFWNDRVQKFTADGVYITQWGTTGSGDGQFTRPYGIAADSAGYIYVSDLYGNRIQKFTSTGTYVLQWGSTGAGNGQFVSPTGLAVDPAGDIYVSDMNNKRIQKFTSTGVYITQWGSNGVGDGQFVGAYGIAADASGNIYVSDQSVNRVQKFTSSGVYITQWGTYGSGDGQLYAPSGVAVDNSGNVFVADFNNQRMQEFTSDGAFLTKWGSAGTGAGQFIGNAGVAVDNSGNIYTVEDYNNRVQKFGACGSPTPTATGTPSITFTETSTETPVMTLTNTPTPAGSVTATETRSVTPEETETVTLTKTITVTPTPSVVCDGEGSAGVFVSRFPEPSTMWVVAGSCGNEIIIGYNPELSWVNGTLKITIPDGWSPPSMNSTDPGAFMIGDAGVVNVTNISVSGMDIYISVTGLAAVPGPEGQLLIYYGTKMGGGPGACAQSNTGLACFIVEADHDGTDTCRVAGQQCIDVLSAAPTQTVTPTPTQTEAAVNTGTPTPAESVTVTNTPTQTTTATPSCPGDGTAMPFVPVPNCCSTGNTIGIGYSSGLVLWPGSAGYGTLKVRIPDGWPAPSTDPMSPGYFTVDAYDGTVYSAYADGRYIVVTAGDFMYSTSMITVLYGVTTGGGPGFTAPCDPGPYEIIVESDPNGSNTCPILDSPEYFFACASETATPTGTPTLTPPSCCTPTLTPTPTQGTGNTLLSIRKTAGGQPPAVGAIITFEIEIRNNDTNPAYNLAVWDTLPSQVEFVYDYSGVPKTVNGQYIRWDLAGVLSASPLNPGGIVYIRFDCRITGYSGSVPIANSAGCDYDDASGRHEPIYSQVIFYPVGLPAVYPNPAVDYVKFTNIVPGSQVDIFTLSGEYVNSLDITHLTETWMMKNRFNSRVSPGIYYYLIKDENGVTRYKGKIFIVRANY